MTLWTVSRRVRAPSAVLLDGQRWIYHEMTRAGGAHDVRLLRVRAT